MSILTFPSPPAILIPIVTAERPITLEDIRNLATNPNYRGFPFDNRGILIGGWSASESENPLPEALQEMADDIAKWFNPNQEWQLVEVRTGFINLRRIVDSSAKEVYDEEAKKWKPRNPIQFKARGQEPDKFTPFFHFDAKHPPTTRGLFGRQRAFDFPQVFSPEFRGRANLWREGSADVHPEKIGSVYPLEQALAKLSSPYYLVGATVSVNERGVDDQLLTVTSSEQRGSTRVEPATSLAVMVFMQDLGDYLRLEESRIRRVRRQFDKRFNIPVSPPSPAGG